VHLAEELFVRLFMVTLVFVILASALSVWFAHLGAQPLSGPAAITIAVAGLSAAFAISALLRPRRAYCWLRYSRARQIAPAAAGALAMLVNGQDSPSWWIALALLTMTATVSSFRLSMAAASLAAAAFLLGTVVRGERIIGAEDAGVLASTIGLVAYTIVSAYIVDGFARFVLALHRLEHELMSAPAPAPLRVENLAPPPETCDVSLDDRTKRRASRDPSRPSCLTVRQLEAVLLARDGLKQAEIAVSLGISPRQVERLLSEARARAGAATTSQLVAMVVTDHLVATPTGIAQDDAP
jgi:DNA-binding CsgD family transcriptional regulator